MKTFVAAALAATIVAVPASASPVLNGSFEDPASGVGLNGNSFESLSAPGGASFDIWTELPGWRTVSGAGIEVQTNSTLSFIDAQDGQHYVELDSTNNSAISQSVFLDAGLYQLSFHFAPRLADTTSNGIDFRLSGAGGALVSDGVGGPSATYPFGTWVEVVREFSVTSAGDYDLFFGASGRDDGAGGLIDTVSIAAVAPPVIPLPAPALLLIAGLGAFGVIGRRKPKAA